VPNRRTAFSAIPKKLHLLTALLSLSVGILILDLGLKNAGDFSNASFQILIYPLIVGTLGIIAAWSIVVFRSRIKATSIKPLLMAAQQISEGRMGARTGLPHTPDALGQLAKAFDNMASLLEKKDIEHRRAEESLSQARSEMEKKAKERTADLTRANALLSEEIVERRRLEEVLRESERKFKTLFQLSPEVIFLASLDDARIHEVNETFCRFFGYRREETVGKVVGELGIWADLNEYVVMMGRLDSQGKVNDFECRLLTKSGENKTVLMSVGTLEVNGRAFMLSVARDITERKRAQEEREHLVTAIEQVTEGIMIADSNHVIQYANPAYERLTGYAKSKLIGQPADIHKGDVRIKSLYKRIWGTLTDNDAWSERITAQRKDGTTYEVEALTSPVRDASGAIINFISIRRDVTQEARLERELRQAQKMESIGTLAGGIAHDFNNILAAISGFAELAVKNVNGNAIAQKYIEQVLKASCRAADLVKQILAFSRQTEQERKPLRMATIVKEVLTLLRSSLPSTIEIKQDIETGRDEDMVLADLTQLHQVLLNLCTNAAHAMGAKGGTLSLKLSAVAAPPLVSGYPQRKAGHYVCLTVSDTGHGMSAAVMDRIFDPYFTTKRPGEGTGLGLSVVQGIVKSYGGVMTVSSEAGRGTTFNIFLPGLEKMVVEKPQISESLSTGSERILFVDDEATLADMGKSMLETLGYSVTAKTSSLEALQYFRDRPDDFDLVFTDMTMPSLTGKDLAREITAIRKDIPVILCSGFSDAMDDGEDNEMGIRDFVLKPFVMSTLAKTIRNALDCPDDGGDLGNIKKSTAPDLEVC
jgi:PAS domain S-box-containing protein